MGSVVEQFFSSRGIKLTMKEMHPQGHAHLRQDQQWEELLAFVRGGAEVRTYSHAVQPGDIFVALPGTRTDGSRFIPQAVANGAAWVVHPRRVHPLVQSGVRFFSCADPGLALGRLAAARYKTEEIRPFVVGITGTNGKTTVSYLVEHLLAHAGKGCGVLGTISYRWAGLERRADLTTPGCLDIHAMLAAMAKDRIELACMEVSSHALEQQRTAGVPFDLTVFTNLTQDHLDYHQDMEAYFQSKAKLFTQNHCASVLNCDDLYGQRLTVMSKPGRCFSLAGKEIPGWPCLQGHIERMDRNGQILCMKDRTVGSWTIRSGLVGRHNAANLLAAQAIGLELGLLPQDMTGLEDFTGPPGRMQRIQNPEGLHVFVDYAHTPDALDNVLSALRDLDFERLIVVFGCGGDRDPGKRPLMGQSVAKYADVAVLTSDNPRHEDPEAIMQAVLPGLALCPQVITEPDRRKAIHCALQVLEPKDALLIAGKGHENTQQIGERKLLFSDQQVVVEYWE
jgi:UDP-N-acetylmuramoyl-L-alanyl-D-glutamate--2,6-diaminopimelate ligase